MKHNYQSGQILLVTLLILVVATTITLSLVSRSTTDVAISRQVEESLRAFSAAEAGIERSLMQGAAIDINEFTSTEDVDVTDSPLGTSNSLFVDVASGDYAPLWLVNHNSLSQLGTTYFTNSYRVCWEDNGTPATTPAIEVAVYYRSGNDFLVRRFAYDTVATRGNNFTAAGITNSGCGGSTNRQVTIPAIANAVMVRVKPHYAVTDISFEPVSGSFPRQGNVFKSCGLVENTSITRCIQATQPYKTPLSLFDNVLYARSGSIQ